MMTRHKLLRSILFALMAAGLPALTSQSLRGAPPGATESAGMLVYIGTYTSGTSKGIYAYRLNLKTGGLKPVGTATGIQNPSFLALDPKETTLYAVSESRQSKDEPSGAVAAFAIDHRTGNLRFINKQATMGPGPCHLVVDHAGKHVLAANYTGGSVVVLPIRPDGGLDMACAFIQHEGASVHPRQKQPHAHCILVDARDRFVLAADLGLDKVLIYRYDDQRGALSPNPNMPAAIVAPGSGPRHFAFHPGGRFGYVINEINSTVTAFRYDEQRGRLESLQTLSTLPADFQGDNTTAEIAVSPNGKFVYGSNRGHNSIAVFAVDERTGRLSLVSHHSTRGEMPRNFAIDPTGSLLLAANQRTDTVAVFRIDSNTGKLTFTGNQISVPKPVCIVFKQ